MNQVELAWSLKGFKLVGDFGNSKKINIVLNLLLKEL